MAARWKMEGRKCKERANNNAMVAMSVDVMGEAIVSGGVER
jgi:hypothetical protein